MNIRRYIRNRAFWAYLIVGFCLAAILILLFWITVTTRQIAANTAGTLDGVHKQLSELQRHIEEDHQRQDERDSEIKECLVNLFVEKQPVTKDQIGACTRPEASDTGTTPGGQANTSSILQPSLSSQGNNEPPQNSSQPDNSLHQPQPAADSSILDSLVNTLEVTHDCVTGGLLPCL